MSDEQDQNQDPPLEGQDGAAAPPAEGEGGSFGKKKILMIAGAAVLLLAGVGAGLYFTGMLDSLLGGGKESGEHAEAGGEGHGEEAEGGEHGGGGAHGASAFLAIPPMIVNLNSEDGTPRYLRLSVQLEMKTPEDVVAVEAVLPRVVDQFQTYLRELRVKDLRGSAGIYRLQMELLWRVNQAAAPVEVKDVLFQEILIQ